MATGAAQPTKPMEVQQNYSHIKNYGGAEGDNNIQIKKPLLECNQF